MSNDMLTLLCFSTAFVIVVLQVAIIILILGFPARNFRPEEDYEMPSGLSLPSGMLCANKKCEFVSGLYNTALPQPCNDFYEYVCAQWKKGEDSFNSSVIMQQDDRNKGSVLAALRAALVPPRGQTAMQKAAGLFQSCVALGNENSNSSQDPKADILDFLAKHGATLEPQSSVSAWHLALDFSLNYGLPTLYDVKVNELSNYGKHPEIVLSMRSSFLENHLRNNSDIVNQLKWLGMDGKRISAISKKIELAEHYLFLASNAVMSDNEPAKWNASIRPLHKLEEIVTSQKGYAWNSYMQDVTGGLLPGEHNFVFESNHIETFLVKIFRTLDANLLAVWVAFDVSWQLSQMAHVASASKTFAENRNYHFHNTGSFWRQRQCFTYTAKVMQSASYTSYFHSVVSKQIWSRAKDVVSSIAVLLRAKIKDSHWLDQDTKNNMLQKLVSMKRIIGYPEGTQDEDSLNSLYASYEDSRTSFVDNWLSASRSRMRRSLQQIYEEDVVRALNKDISQAAGHYAPPENTMYLGLGLLVPPFFDTIAPIDYASMGHFAAHEMMHSLYGLNIDGVNRNKWAPEEEYQKRIRCIRDAYLQPKLGHSNSLQDEEILADFGAVTAVYSAYLRQKNERNPPLRLRKFPEISGDQLFFIAFCYNWCSNVSPSQRYPDFKTRCNSLVKNMPEFSAAFNCPVESPMNPKDKCNFW